MYNPSKLIAAVWLTHGRAKMLFDQQPVLSERLVPHGKCKKVDLEVKALQ